MEYKDYYKTLGVPRSASAKEIKTAYRKLAREFHPDVNPGDKAAEQKFQEINEAYEVLSNPDNRKKYDTLGQYWKQAGAAGGPRPGGRPQYDFSYENLGDVFNFTTGGGGGGPSGFSSFFDRFFSSNRRGPQGAQPRPSTAVAEVEISLDEAFNGTVRTLQMAHGVCPACTGVGATVAGVCQHCRGSGQDPTPRQLEVKIPAGVTSGSKVKAADVLLTIKLKPHPDYEVKGKDLIRRVPISLFDAVLGGEAKFSTLKGKEVTLKIPPETQNGRQFRLTGQGLPASGGKTPGDLYVKVEVELPTRLTDRERQLFAELAQGRPNGN